MCPQVRVIISFYLIEYNLKDSKGEHTHIVVDGIILDLFSVQYIIQG